MVKRFYHGEPGRAKTAMKEFQSFRNKEGAIGDKFARMHYGKKHKASPMVCAGDCAKDESGWKWWLNFGEELPTLQYLAVRVCLNIYESGGVGMIPPASHSPRRPQQLRVRQIGPTMISS